MQHLTFHLNTEFVLLNRLLKLTGFCQSGGAGKALVGAGGIRVDGNVELRKTCKIRAGQVVDVGDARISVVAARSLEDDESSAPCN